MLKAIKRRTLRWWQLSNARKSLKSCKESYRLLRRTSRRICLSRRRRETCQRPSFIRIAEEEEWWMGVHSLAGLQIVAQLMTNRLCSFSPDQLWKGLGWARAWHRCRLDIQFRSSSHETVLTNRIWASGKQARCQCGSPPRLQKWELWRLDRMREVDQMAWIEH